MKPRPRRPRRSDSHGHRGAGAPPARLGARTSPGPPKEGQAFEEARVETAWHVVPAGRLAELTAEVASRAIPAVRERDIRLGRFLAGERRGLHELGPGDQRFLASAIHSYFRWLGWVEPVASGRIEEGLLLACLLDLPVTPPACRVWARHLGLDPSALLALGDAPSWTTRTEGFKRIVGSRPISVDPWRLFPPWFREVLPLPPGSGTPKSRFVELIAGIQVPPSLWVRAVAADPERTWNELRGLGIRPWVHRRLHHAARLDAGTDVTHLPPFERGELEIQDLASQAIALACDPEPGERWWDLFAGTGGSSLQLAGLMGGKGVVVATETRAPLLKSLTLRARRGPYRNLSTKSWDGRHVAGKPGSFAGVLVDPPSSALGLWRRHPDARWTTRREDLEVHAERQAAYLRVGAQGVRPGGVLVYAVPTFSLVETTEIVRAFLDEQATFRLDPFPHPLTGEPTDGTLRLWPHEADIDGLFLTRMIRER